MKKRYKLLIALLFIVGSILYILPNHVLPYTILQPQRVQAINTLDTKNRPYKNVEVLTKDTLKLKGYFVKSSLDSTYASIILVHGIGGCKQHFTDLAITLSNKGYDSWLFDNRAHGESEGQFSTYGYKEKEDISAIIDKIKNNNPMSKIGIWGNSLGGAIAIQAIEQDKRIEFGIIESTFTELNQIVYDYQKRFSYNIGLKWICDLSLAKAETITDFKTSQVKPINSVKNITQPMLIAHGNKDENIKFEYGKALYKNLASRDKEFVEVENAGHYNMFSTGGENYKNKLFNFIKKQTIKKEF